jgi:CHAT domain-containing protein
LPAAEAEVREISALFPRHATAIAGASESDFKAAVAETQHSIFHFALHGLPSMKDPGRAALLFLPSDRDDGLLQAHEIAALDVRATLVTFRVSHRDRES